MRQTITIVIVMLGIIICSAMASGCIDSLPKTIVEKPASTIPEPEAGIATWISAMNSKDIPRLYALSPSVIRSNISEKEFIRANADNLLLQPGVVFSELEILNKTSEGSRATIIEWIAMDRPGQGRIPMKFTFRLFFENGEWKVWTEPLDE
jgi:hypothetical protein